MTSHAFTIPEATRLAQQKASDPRASVWVGANAGSGKTYVLSRRVIRLLLAGTNPSSILCLTFTKAAAAEMANRVFDELGRWVLYDNNTLDQTIEELEGTKPNADKRRNARRLFARALETPGGLKIQTIHAFCERLLHQFPLEAGVASHFEVLDERRSKELLQLARNDILSAMGGETDNSITQSMTKLIAHMSDQAIEDGLNALVHKHAFFHDWMRHAGSLDKVIEELRELLGAKEEDTPKTLAEAIIHSPDWTEKRIANIANIAITYGTEKDQKQIANLIKAHKDAHISDDIEKCVELWTSVFLKKDGAPRQRVLSKALIKATPDISNWIMHEIERLLSIIQRQRSHIAYQATAALFTIGHAIIERYEHEKMARALLDFNDLIERSALLLSNSEATEWVHYKLDQGIDHILVDEAQDTSPRQWDVIERLADEFFVGHSSRKTRRTIFAVGDEKQSIYSFQGAAPDRFNAVGRRFMRKTGAVKALFENVPLILSFRSTPDILQAVDQVFDPAEMRAGLTSDAIAPVHEAIRANDVGLVEIWPPLESSKIIEPTEWTDPLDHESQVSPRRRLAAAIAKTIKRWFDEKECLESSGKPIRPGDILILVRRRDTFSLALNRALKDLTIPIAGSDRLILTEHIAIEDLMAVIRFVLLPEDDLSLATLLKSPLFGFNEDALFKLAYKREKTLWASLRGAATHDEPAHQAHHYLSMWLARADYLTPYAFFAIFLGKDGMRRRILSRLGPEAEDILEEFLSLALDYEQNEIPSLQGFLSWLEAVPTTIKRDMDAGRNEVRVMTVHGAKGLEAPIVILADTTSPPTSRHDPTMLDYEKDKDSGITWPIWALRKDMQTSLHTNLLQRERDKAHDEYKRLLYVAMTRACDRLYVGAYVGQRGLPDQCWYRLIDEALQREATEEQRPEFDTSVAVWRTQTTKVTKALSHKKDKLPNDTMSATEKPLEQEQLPTWLYESVPTHISSVVLSPSTAFDEKDDKPTVFIPPHHPQTIHDDTNNHALRRGQYIHTMFEFLPDLATQNRRSQALQYLSNQAADWPLSHHQKLVEDVIQILDDPRFAMLFGQDSRAEVSISGHLTKQDGTCHKIIGRIDRLVVNKEHIIIADFKTNRPYPRTMEQIPQNYITQLAIYAHLLKKQWPDKMVETLLIWTDGPAQSIIPEAWRIKALNMIRGDTP